ncbi:MAG: membrane protein insertion efficiency factor YidD [Nautiliaceae bacterium]
MLRKILVKLINAYKFISPFFGNKCRYYPTCSTYAIWEFENDNFIIAFFKSFLRILRCNQFFKGGIDYPVVSKKLGNVKFGEKREVSYWYIPIKKNKFIVIKADR